MAISFQVDSVKLPVYSLVHEGTAATNTNIQLNAGLCGNGKFSLHFPTEGSLSSPIITNNAVQTSKANEYRYAHKYAINIHIIQSVLIVLFIYIYIYIWKGGGGGGGGTGNILNAIQTKLYTTIEDL